MFSSFLASSNLLFRILLDVSGGCLTCLVFSIIWNQLRSAYHLRHVPGPTAPSRLWGSEWDMHKALPGQRYLEWKTRYGNVFKIKGALGRTHLAISDLRAVKFILEEHVFDFPKPQGVREWFRLLVGEGLLAVEGKAAHAHQRRIVASALTQQAVRPLLATFYGIATKIADTVAIRIDNSPNGTVEEDVQWWANRWSLDNIGLAGFSYNFNSISGDSNPLAVALEALTNSAENFTSFVMKALFFTFPSILKIPSEKGKLIRNTRQKFGEVAINMWNEAKAGGKAEGNTLMASMMKAEGADQLTQGEIAAQLRTLVQAGYETPGCGMAWLLYEIARHPHVQSRLHEELAQLAPEPTFDDFVERAPYLDAVLKESLRLHPPVLELTHVAKKNMIVPLAKPLPTTGAMEMMIPRGTVIQIPVNVMQADPDIWGADTTKFKPERWLISVMAEKLQGNLMAFSAGPRVCPGRHFAVMEMKTLVAVLLKQFTFRPVPTKPIEPFLSFVVRPRVRGQKATSLPILLSKVKD